MFIDAFTPARLHATDRYGVYDVSYLPIFGTIDRSIDLGALVPRATITVSVSGTLNPARIRARCTPACALYCVALC